MDVERLSIVRFEEELRHAARGRLPLVGNLLDAAVKKIEQTRRSPSAACSLVLKNERSEDTQNRSTEGEFGARITLSNQVAGNT